MSVMRCIILMACSAVAAKLQNRGIGHDCCLHVRQGRIRIRGMSKVTAEQLEMVRQWAGEGVDLNGIQKRLAAECSVHMTYMDVRFLLLDHGIEIATAAAPAAEKKEEPAAATAEPTEPAPEAGQGGSLVVTLDELTLPGTLISGKVSFASGTRGGWQIDQLGRFAWNDLQGQPTPEELQAFQVELTQILSRG